MGSWIAFTLLAALMQTLRTAGQKSLAGTVSPMGSTLVRYAFGLPSVVAYFLCICGDEALPPVRAALGDARFATYVLLASPAQIAATALLVTVFGRRNFTVATAFAKTEAAQAASFGTVFFASASSAAGRVAVLLGFVGVFVIGLPRPGSSRASTSARSSSPRACCSCCRRGGVERSLADCPAGTGTTRVPAHRSLCDMPKAGTAMDTIETLRAPGRTDDEARWSAVAARDESADGAFLYGVLTTGVYCHPSCPSRAARREHVSFHATAAAAEAAGFRACRRCRADGPAPALRRAALVERACRLLDAEEAPRIDEVAAGLGIGRHALRRDFRAVTGLTPKAWQLAARRARLDAIVRSHARTTDAALDGGYGSATRFHADARSRLGMRPDRARARGAGETIRHATADSSLGRLLVAWTDAGVCAVTFGTDDAALEADLVRRFGAATLVADEGAGTALVQAVVDRVDGEGGASAALALDIRGTVFQEKVWRALQAIPVGTTASYADVARAVGEPRSSRAVAQACGANPAAVLVPCHRVVRADGALSGYRWGVERKAALLEREKAPD